MSQALELFTNMRHLIEHLEYFLGPINHGWNGSDGAVWPFQIARFSGGPITSSFTYCTAGLSDHSLTSAVTGKFIHHELMMMSQASRGDLNIPAILHQVGLDALESNQALLCGDVIEKPGTVVVGTQMQSLFVYLPSYLPGEFNSFLSRSGIRSIIAWLIPITRVESKYVKKNGWEAFVDLLEANDPDLLDYHRKSIV